MSRIGTQENRIIPLVGRQEEVSGVLPQTIPYFLADKIQSAIVFGHYKPGEGLREIDLAERFQATRGPVREALRILELRGLVEHMPRRGFRVPIYTPEDIDSLYEMRASLEAMVVKSLVGRDLTELIPLLEEADRQMKALATAGDLEGYFQQNRRFHRLLRDYTDKPPLLRMNYLLDEMTMPLRYLLVRENFEGRDSYHYHEEIIDAIRAGDFEVAEFLVRDHILRNLEAVKATYAKYLAAVAAAS